MTATLHPRDLLDWHERGEFVQLGWAGAGILRLHIGDDGGSASIELSDRAASALGTALADWFEPDDLPISDEAEEVRAELAEVIEERDRLREELRTADEVLAGLRAQLARAARGTT